MIHNEMKANKVHLTFRLHKTSQCLASVTLSDSRMLGLTTSLREDRVKSAKGENKCERQTWKGNLERSGNEQAGERLYWERGKERVRRCPAGGGLCAS